jgi:pimeloyl-ACP methyl ester carboxylesterase
LHHPKIRSYGAAPFNLAVVHGGPGAAGEMAPIARELSRTMGVLEPLQTALSLEGQVAELKVALEQHGDLPVTLIGFSWGAWLSYLLAAQYPALVRKLILISSGGFEEVYAQQTEATRLSRMTPDQKQRLNVLAKQLDQPGTQDENEILAELGALFTHVDAYAPVAVDAEVVDASWEIYCSVWPQAAALRGSGRLLEFGRSIVCPVTAIHGEHDPHPAQGVQAPLAAVLKQFRFILLKHCGHKPWIEKEAMGIFYQTLRAEI